MGTRSVSGNFTCYLNDVANGSLDLFEKLQESRGVITNAFAMTFNIGGGSNTPRVAVTLPKAHLELPAHDLIRCSICRCSLPWFTNRLIISNSSGRYQRSISYLRRSLITN